MRLQVHWRRPRRAQRLPELNNYPETPQAYYEGEFPGSKIVETLRTEFNVRLQKLPELNVYPITPENYPALVFDKTNKIGFDVKLQSIPEHNEYPRNFGDGIGATLEKANKIVFNARLQSLPQLDLYPETNWHPGEVLEKANRVEFKVRHLTAIETLAQPKNFGEHPGSALAESFRVEFKVKLQYLPELNVYTETPTAYYEGEYPGSALATSFHTEFKIKLQSSPELNVYPLAQAAEDVVAWETHFEKTKRTKFRLQNVELNTYPATPPMYYTGYYPGSIAVETLKTGFNVKLQLLPQLDFFPVAAVIVDVDAFKLWPTYRTSFKVKIQNVIGVERFPAPIPSVIFAFGVPSRIDPDGQGVEGLF